MVGHGRSRRPGPDVVRPGDLDEAARLLDQHYIPTRYPNGLDIETAPAAYYQEGDAEQCLRSARSILARVSTSFEN